VLLIQWTGAITALAGLTRADKIRMLAWLAGIVVLAIVAADYGRRLGRHGTGTSGGVPAGGARAAGGAGSAGGAAP
jgi:hypothetical protein